MAFITPAPAEEASRAAIWPAFMRARRHSSPHNLRTPSRNTCISLNDEWAVAAILRVAGVHLVPARDFSSGRGRPTTATVRGVTGDQKVPRRTLPSQRSSDEVSGEHPCAGARGAP